MRKMQDPVNRAIALAGFRSGLKHREVAHTLDITEGTLRREEEIDPVWHDVVQDAMHDAFDPVLKRALELSLQADAGGLNEGAHKAMALVFQHYGKALDRESRKQEIVLKAEAQAAVEAQRPQVPAIVTPAAVSEFMKGLPAAPQPEEVPDDDPV